MFIKGVLSDRDYNVFKWYFYSKGGIYFYKIFFLVFFD